MTSSQPSLVWLITGCSSGLGRALSAAALARGHAVAMTARDPATLDDLVARAPDRAVALPLDITDGAAIARTVDAALARFGHVDCLVNNAGYGYYAAVEEGEDHAMRALFETNVFGPAALMRRVLPHMRARKSGHVFNVSSVAGLLGNPGSAFYSASKFALEGMSESLASEVQEFGIRVTLVEPGPFRTEFQGRSMQVTGTPVAAYAKTAIARREQVRASLGTQAGDPARAAEIIVDLALSASPPFRIVLGKSGFDRVVAKLEAEVAGLVPLRAFAYAADFPDAT